jgi:hypothetical protein
LSGDFFLLTGYRRFRLTQINESYNFFVLTYFAETFFWETGLGSAPHLNSSRRSANREEGPKRTIICDGRRMLRFGVRAADCLIKGNISSSGERIYHVPGQRYYNKTLINLSKRERWFCTEQEAVSAGWRKAKV